jgi:hypothetical protein
MHWNTWASALGVGTIIGAMLTGLLNVYRDHVGLRQKRRAIKVGLTVEITEGIEVIKKLIQKHENGDFSKDSNYFRLSIFVPWWFYDHQFNEIALLTATQAKNVVTYYTLLYAIRRLVENSDKDLLPGVMNDVAARLPEAQTAGEEALKELQPPIK